MKRKLVLRISEEDEIKECLENNSNAIGNMKFELNMLQGRLKNIIQSNRIDSEDFLDDESVRSGNLSRVEVLDRVKKINTISGLDMMTREMVAEYLEANPETLKSCVYNNLDELERNGLKLYSRSEIINIVEELGSSLNELPKINNVRGRYYIDGVKLNNKGTLLFNRRVILNIGMLLRDSEVAKAIRKCLLDVMDTDEGKELFNSRLDQIEGGITNTYNGILNEINNINSRIDEFENTNKILFNQLQIIRTYQQIMNENMDRLSGGNY